MKRIILFFLLIVPLVTGIDARTFVLITGVSNYGSENINLHQTTKDAKRFKAVMETQTKDITLLTSRYANKANILEKLSAICNRAQKGDRIIFFFSGHGMPGAICTYDYTITYEELVDKLAESSAGEKICFIDACHAGTMADAVPAQRRYSWVKAVTENRNQAFFVSCRADEYSMESAFVGQGYFTQALLKGIRGKSDEDSNRKVTVIELFKYIYNDVTYRTKGKQHPQLIAPKTMYDSVVAVW